MSDTLHSCLIDVTNNNAPTFVTHSKDDALSSQDDSVGIPQLSSPLSASSMSSPSSLLVEVTTATDTGKGSYQTTLPTCSSPETSEIDQSQQNNQAATSRTPTPITNSPLYHDGFIFSASGRVDLKQYRCRYCDSTHSGKWNDVLDGVNTCCQRCYIDQCTIISSTTDTIDSDTTTPKRRRFDDDNHQHHNHLDTTSSIIGSQDLSTESSLSTSASLQPAPPSSIVSSIHTSSIASPSSITSTPYTLSDDPSNSLDTVNTTSNQHSTSSPSSFSETAPRLCLECHASNPPLWRNGPDGQKTLCNACGLRYSKFLRGTLANWHKGPQSSSNVQKKKRSSQQRLSKATSATNVITTATPTTDPASISLATSMIKNNGSVGGNAMLEPKLKKCDTLHERKTYLKAGMHSGGFQNMDVVPFKFTLPLHQGAFLLDMERDFELPLDIVEEYESGRLFGWTDYSPSKKPPRYIRILHNSFVERKARKDEHQAVCHCLRPASGMGCGEDCLNRMMFFECNPATCPCGELCSNQRFRQRQFVKGLKVYLTEGRGWGIMTKEFIKQGTLITEYRGEIISDKTCQQRIRTVYKHQKNFYFLDYHKGEVIDACSKGSEARFINHGCDPNCHIEKWSRAGEFHVGVFASKDIPIDSELFYDYNFSLFDTESIGQECRCGSSNCRGFLGKRPSHPKKNSQ